MSRLRFALALFGILAAAGPVAAADLYADSGSAYGVEGPPAQNWSGLYVGLNGGFGGGGRGVDAAGFFAGLTLGRNWHVNNLVYGIEGDVAYSGIEDDGYREGFDVDSFGTVRGRIGYAFDRFVAFGTGGLAWAATEFAARGEKDSAVRLGLALSVGVEAAITEQVSAKAELIHMNYRAKTYSAGGRDEDIDPDLTTMRVGVNYRF